MKNKKLKELKNWLDRYEEEYKYMGDGIIDEVAGIVKDLIETERFEKQFEIASVSRENLTEFISPAEAFEVTDAEMEKIASKMTDVYYDNEFWENLKMISKEVLD